MFKYIKSSQDKCMFAFIL